MRKIRKIEPPLTSIEKRKRVAAYARVSMECEQLLHSLSAQISYYSSLIQNNLNWEYAGVYADEGITGTETKNRSEFNRLISDCDAGNIDIVLVKSISRFARNTVDLLETVRHLKNIGVEIRFERENISTFSGDGELLLTLLASIAQEESESISRNEKWAIKKKFKKGEPNTSLRCFGYDWDAETGRCIINEEEAVWVRYIYCQYLSGTSIKGLAKNLAEKEVTALRGKALGRTTIRRILTSETYIGDVILQRYFSPKVQRPKVNKGEVPKYMLSDAHEAIISHEDFEAVQQRLNRRARTADNAGYEKTFFAGMVKCGKCGYACNHVEHSNYKGRYIHIECNNRKTKKCDLLPIREYELKEIMEGILGKRDILDKIVMFDDHIEFCLKGGKVKTYIRKYPKGGYNKHCFSRKVRCGECGCTFVRMNCSKKGYDMCWICVAKKTDKNACSISYITEDELIKASIKILGTDDDYEMRFFCEIEKAVVFNDRVDFYFKKGDVKTWQRE
jgi:DNA invertase Pin-like site-specific DNA recombinase